MLHGETLALIDAIRERYGIRVERYRPRHEAVVAFVGRHGDDAMYSSVELRKACCALRKLEPLGRMLAGRDAWITGLRREQSSERAEVAFESLDDAGRTKLNPLADWSWGDVWHYIATSRRALQRAPRPLLPEHRLRAVHPRDRRRRRLPRRPLVVGAGREGMRPARRRARGRRRRSPHERRRRRSTGTCCPSSTPAHLDGLEEEAIFILRETAAAFERPALLFSGGKDSCVVLRLAEKAFKRRLGGRPLRRRLPFPLLHVDTGHNFPK